MTQGEKARSIPAHNKSGEYLKASREALGISKEEAARCIGRSVRTLERFERHGVQSTTRVTLVFKFCEAYGISSDRLLEIAAIEA